jgi:phage terminase large subunit-like protein
MSAPVLIPHLGDLIVAITVAHEALINCERVVEGVKALMAPQEDDEGKAWQIMRDALNLEKAYLTLITQSFRKRRYGRHERVGGLLVNEITLYSRTVMNRYLEYRKAREHQIAQFGVSCLLTA